MTFTIELLVLIAGAITRALRAFFDYDEKVDPLVAVVVGTAVAYTMPEYSETIRAMLRWGLLFGLAGVELIDIGIIVGEKTVEKVSRASKEVLTFFKG